MIKKILNPMLLEIFIVFLGAVYFCANLRNSLPLIYPAGGEFILLNQTHFIWELFTKCGTCIFWNGILNGGAPTFGELHNAPAHPFVFIPAILFGAINGGKITLFLAFLAAGIGQWRLAKAMGLGAIPRVWTALMVMFGGELSGKMEIGNSGLILSAGCSILFLSELYHFVFDDLKKSSATKLAVFLSLCVLSGQGYLQLALALLWIPVSLIFALIRHGRRALWVMIETAGLTFYFCGFFLIPLMHFMPNVIKDVDPALNNPQPIGYSVLNLVIKDLDFFQLGTLGMSTTPYAYYIYIGWIPILLAVFGAWKNMQVVGQKLKTLWLMLLPVLVFVFASEEVLIPLKQKIPSILNLRTVSAMTMLTVPPLIALAGIGLEKLLNFSEGYRVWKSAAIGKKILITLQVMVAIGAASYCLVDEVNANRKFLYLGTFTEPEQALQDAMLPDEVAWVEPVNRDFLPYFFSRGGRKFSIIFRPWQWFGRPSPQPAVKAMHHPGGMDPVATYRVGEMDYYVNEAAVYAALYDHDQIIAKCRAETLGGGEITVTCPNVSQSGTDLIVQEHYFAGWQAWVDGENVALDPAANFLTIHNINDAAATIVFKYQPWDVWIGIALSLLGILFAIMRIANNNSTIAHQNK